MTQRTVAGWVAPVAAAKVEERRRVLAFARAAPAALWDQPSDVPGWTHKDILSHLAGGNDLVLQRLLRAVVARASIDPALLDPDTDAENADGIAQRRSWSRDRLIAELERDGAEVEDLLSRLTERDRDLPLPGSTMRLSDFLRRVADEHHDLLHLQQLEDGLRTADG